MIVRVELAGICRTDLRAARGELSVPLGRILGHEAVGYATARGPVTRLDPGTRVAVSPWLACGACKACRADKPLSCSQAKFIGLDHNGVFASEISIPEVNLVPVDSALDRRAAAMLEPVAAALAAVAALESTKGQVAVLGSGRIAELTKLALKTELDLDLTCLAPENASEPESYSAIVDTV